MQGAQVLAAVDQGADEACAAALAAARQPRDVQLAAAAAPAGAEEADAGQHLAAAAAGRAQGGVDASQHVAALQQAVQEERRGGVGRQGQQLRRGGVELQHRAIGRDQQAGDGQAVEEGREARVLRVAACRARCRGIGAWRRRCVERPRPVLQPGEFAAGEGAQHLGVEHRAQAPGRQRLRLRRAGLGALVLARRVRHAEVGLHAGTGRARQRGAPGIAVGGTSWGGCAKADRSSRCWAEIPHERGIAHAVPSETSMPARSCATGLARARRRPPARLEPGQREIGPLGRTVAATGGLGVSRPARAGSRRRRPRASSRPRR